MSRREGLAGLPTAVPRAATFQEEDSEGAPRPDPGPPSARSRVAFLADSALVAGIKAGNPTAMGELFDRFGAVVLRILARILGPDRELADLQHDVFVRALQSIHELRDAEALAGWIRSIAVHVARGTIERRVRRRRWLVFVDDDALVEPASEDDDARSDAREALRAAYTVLGKMPVDERIAFALRYIDGMELAEAAAACSTSLATFKRVLAKAESRFRALAARSPALVSYLEGGTRWTDR